MSDKHQKQATAKATTNHLYYISLIFIRNCRAIANDLAGLVFAGPLFLKSKTNFYFYKKQVINERATVIFGFLG